MLDRAIIESLNGVRDSVDGTRADALESYKAKPRAQDDVLSAKILVGIDALRDQQFLVDAMVDPWAEAAKREFLRRFDDQRAGLEYEPTPPPEISPEEAEAETLRIAKFILELDKLKTMRDEMFKLKFALDERDAAEAEKRRIARERGSCY